MRGLLAKGEREHARRIVHSLKGASGTVGATEVHQLAIALDLFLRGEASSGDAIPLVTQLESAQKNLVQIILTL